MRVSTDDYFHEIAKAVAARATCDRAHVGAVLVKSGRILSTGFNGSPTGLDHCDDVGHEIENFHCVRTIHAELNAIVQAALHGVSTQEDGVWRNGEELDEVDTSWTVNNSATKWKHPSKKPVRLIKQAIEVTTPAWTTSVILDPFAGSGTTGQAANENWDELLAD